MENLNKLTKLLGADRIVTPEEIEQVLKGVVEILASYRKGTEEVKEETIKVVNSLLNDTITFNKKHSEEVAKFATEMEKEHGAKMKDLERALSEANNYLTEVKNIKTEPGEKSEDADKEYISQEVLKQINLSEYKENIITGEELIDKINEL